MLSGCAAFLIAFGIAQAQNQKRDELASTGSFRAAAGRYVLAKSRADVCIPFVSALNQARMVASDSCASHLPQHGRFSELTWEPMTLDLKYAEKIIKAEVAKASEDAAWQEWLKKTQRARGANKVKMWRLIIDIDGDGRQETTVRMLDAAGVSAGTDCTTQTDHPLYVIDDTGDQYAAKQSGVFKATSMLSDVYRDTKTNRYVFVEWAPDVYAGAGIWLNHEPRVISGATKSVGIYEAEPSIGLIPKCNIQWVPASPR
jgi:hypothetical protein